MSFGLAKIHFSELRVFGIVDADQAVVLKFAPFEKMSGQHLFRKRCRLVEGLDGDLNINDAFGTQPGDGGRADIINAQG